jgi:hypothetical protein
VAERAAGANTAKIAAIPVHAARLFRRKKARGYRAMRGFVRCSAAGNSLFGAAGFPVRLAGKPGNSPVTL